MTVALLAVGLDPGIGMFHADFDVDRRWLSTQSRQPVRMSIIGSSGISKLPPLRTATLLSFRTARFASHIRSIHISRTPRCYGERHANRSQTG